MIELSNVELTKIEGGGFKFSIGTGIIIGGAISFLIGVANGLLRPLGCSSAK